MGIKTLVGAWLGSDEEKNEEEMIILLNWLKKGLVDAAVSEMKCFIEMILSEEELLKKSDT